MKTALITGASSEIGISIALKLEPFYKLILIKNKNDIDITKFKSEPTIYTCNLKNELELNNLIKKLKNVSVDLLINGAAYDQNELIEDIKMDELMEAIKLNAIVPFILIQKLFNKETTGTIINIASTDGIDTFNDYNLPYATSKATLIHITKQLKAYYKNLNIYAICPNYVNTKSVKEMETNFLKQEMKRINQKELIEIDKVSDKVFDIITTLPKDIIIRMES